MTPSPSQSFHADRPDHAVTRLSVRIERVREPYEQQGWRWHPTLPEQAEQAIERETARGIRLDEARKTFRYHQLQTHG